MSKLKISYGRSRFEKRWKNGEVGIDELFERYRTPIRTPETVAEYQKMSKADRDNTKDVGGAVLGHLEGGRRKKNAVACRSALMLDADHADVGFAERHKATFPHKSCLYSTHSHTPESPRLREVIPLSRDITPEEYNALGRYVAAEQGIDYFDDTTYEPERLMHNPSCPANGEYVYIVTDGELLNPDDYLSRHAEWRDCSRLPHSSRQSEVIRREIKRQADPLEKEGIVGTFCRTYLIEDAIETYLSDVYEPSVMEGRYDYIPADSAAGVVIYEGGRFAFSNHATDPACGRLLNAFDLVRVHKFGDLDEKASFKAMSEFAVQIPKVKIQLAEERERRASSDFAALDEGGDADWRVKLTYMPRSKLLDNSVWNLMLILNNDPDFQNFAYNEFASAVQVTGGVPWERPPGNPFWRDSDTAQLKALIDIRYISFSGRNHDVCFTKVADDRRFHPIREYLDGLPPWDGELRIDALLIDYLGAADTPYTRAVSRKTIVAAVARVKRPGIKFDSIPVLCGPQGTGKSTFIARLGREWYSDSLSIADMKDKTAAEKVQGNWLLELSEMAGIKKMDVETAKSFASRVDDKYRPSYGRVVESHPRQCVIIGTTNSDEGFLRDVTGNRRFWPVRVTGGGKRKPWDLTDEVVGQIWAEALVRYESGEELYLKGDIADSAIAEQRHAMESDDREGLVREYLDTLLPEKWEAMPVYDRRNYIAEPDNVTLPKGTVRRDTVCNLEIWCECFGKRKEDMTPRDSYAIAAIMVRLDGWKRSGEWIVRKPYGRQRTYVRG